MIRKRSDTYHDIETVFYPIHLADEIEIDKSDRHEFHSNVQIDAKTNLCLRSLHFFCERTGINAEVRIDVRKNIPIGAGLGGGSSDAAAVLTALQKMYGNPLSEIELHDIAAQLGADVPFFLKMAPSYATGKGEVIEPIALHISSYILTATPDASVSTVLAYSMVTPTGLKSKCLRDSLLELDDRYADYREVVVNDFETKVIERFPVIGGLKSEMYRLGAQFALMSGSGSSVYGFFADEQSASKAGKALESNFTLRALDLTLPHQSPKPRIN